MLKFRAIYIISVLLIVLQPVMSIKENQEILLERVNSRLEVLSFAADVIFTRVKLFEGKIEKLLNALAANNASMSALCNEEQEKILKAVLNGTESLKLKQNIMLKHLANIETSLQDEFNVNKSESPRQMKQLNEPEIGNLIRQTSSSSSSMNKDNDFFDILKEVRLKQNNLEALFQLILENSEKNSTTEFIKRQFDELKNFIRSLMSADGDVMQPMNKKDQSETSTQQTTTMNVGNEFVDILKEVRLKQNNLEAIFQLILEKSEKNDTSDFIRKQFDDLKNFISSTKKAADDEKQVQPHQELPSHAENLNCLENCDNATALTDIFNAATHSNVCKEDVFLVKVSNSTLKPFYAYFAVNKYLIIQRREDGTQDFYRKWKDYKQGFGDVYGEYWLGLERLRTITNSEQYELLVVLEDYDGSQAYATYSDFRVGTEVDGYPLHVSLHSGTASDGLIYHNGMKFSTYDNDNDNSTTNCARNYKGGWWYKCCYISNLNGRYFSYANSATRNGINWDNITSSLKSVYMAIRPYSLRSKEQCGYTKQDQQSLKDFQAQQTSFQQN